MTALFDGQRAWTRDELDRHAADFAQTLTIRGTRVLATLMDNGAAWVLADLATRLAGVVHVPLPMFFTPAQIGHALASAGADAVLVSAPLAARWPQAPQQSCTLGGDALMLLTLPFPAVPLPPGTGKVTYTSGTTGAPKGVCLSDEAMQAVSAGLAQALAPLQVQRHLCALPFAVLLENIAGLMAPLSVGASCVVLPLGELGWKGSSSFDVATFHATVARHAPHSLILLPQMLAAWVAHLRASAQRAPASLRFVAVGGAAVGAPLIAAARELGIPACEGYGLSEGASVQTLNLPGADRPGSVGRPLPHAGVRIAADGEIEVSGSLFSGYLGDDQPAPAWWPTGDLGRLDDDGFLHVDGRKKHVLITAYGRNVSPEWVETALRGEPAIAQAVVFGDGQPSLSAVLWSAQGEAVIDAAVARVNAGLPDYARVGHWVRARAPFDVDAGLATANGRPRRTEIQNLHRDALDRVAPTPEKPTMSFHAQLLAQTEADRLALVQVPIIQGCLRGEVSLTSYLAFLTEAYHHVRHTVPLLRACKAASAQREPWLLEAMDEYIDEEQGHDEWILDDIIACGGDAAAVRAGQPGAATAAMVAQAYDIIAHGNPLGFFGMVHVLEGTSVALALMAADRIQQHLALPDAAFSYLRSHGTLDREHTAHFALLMDQLDDPRDQADIVSAARAFYRLYGDVFRSLPLPALAGAMA